MSSDIKLLPCPFCGGEGSAFVDKYEKYFTGCLKCNFYYGIEIEHDCELEDGWLAIHDSKEEAINAWNTRKPMDRIVEQLEERRKGYERSLQNTMGSVSTYRKGVMRGYEYSRDLVKGGGKV